MLLIDIWEQYEALLSVFENEEEYYNQPIEGDESFPFPDCSKYVSIYACKRGHGISWSWTGSCHEHVV